MKKTIKTLTYLLRYVNVLKKTMKNTLITYLKPKYLWCFSPPPMRLLKSKGVFNNSLIRYKSPDLATLFACVAPRKDRVSFYLGLKSQA